MTDEVTKELSNDEMYTKIETEKIVKAKSRKRIATLVALCAFFALAVVLIVLSTVPANLRPNCVSNNFYQANFYSSGSSDKVGSVLAADQKAKYDSLVGDLNESFAQPYISAIFSGALSKYDVIEEKFTSFETAAKNEIGESKYIELLYTDAQTLTNKDGSKYQTTISTSKEVEWTITFNKVYIVLNNENGFKDVNVYICADYTKRENGTSSTDSGKFVKITLRANTYKIFENWDSYV